MTLQFCLETLVRGFSQEVTCTANPSLHGWQPIHGKIIHSASDATYFLLKLDSIFKLI